MTKGMLVAVGALLTLGGVAFAAEQSGLISSGNGPGLLAAEVRLAPGGVALAQEVPPPAVLGAAVDCPPAGAGPEDSQQRYDDLGAAFRVIGTLSSFDAVTAVVAGPTGEISASLAQQFDLRGDLSAGSAVDLRGTIGDGGARTAHEVHSACATAGMIDCAGADDPHFQLHVDGDTFEVTGRLESLSADQVQVLGPGLIVEIKRDPGTQIEGGLTTGDPVKVEGTVLSDRQLQALTVALRCQEAITPAPATAASAPSGQPLSAADGNGDEDEDEGDDKDCRRAALGRGAGRLKVKDGEVRIKHGAVLSSDSGSLTVDTPAGPVVVRIDDDTEVSGDLTAAAEVEIEGDLENDDLVLAAQVEVLCPAAREKDNRTNRGGDKEDEGDEDKDEDKDKDKERGRSEDDEGGADD
jgi:Domain of unknown function (DUF5666)